MLTAIFGYYKSVTTVSVPEITFVNQSFVALPVYVYYENSFILRKYKANLRD